MADLVMVLTILGLFAMCGAYVAWCDRLVRSDPTGPATATPTEATLS